MLNNFDFGDYVAGRYDAEITEELGIYISDNFSRLELYSKRVSRTDEAELSDWQFKTASITDAVGDGLAFEIVVDAEIEISGRGHRRSRETDVFVNPKIHHKL